MPDSLGALFSLEPAGPTRRRPLVPLLFGPASLVILALWAVVGLDGRIDRKDALFVIGCGIAFVGVLSAAGQRWRGIVWVVPSSLLGFAGSALLVRDELRSRASYSSHALQFDSNGPRSEWSAEWAGDTNGDGVEDILLATPYEPDKDGEFGFVRVISGRDGTILRALPAPRASFAPAGDLNADGLADLLVHERSGQSASAVSGRDGSVLFRFKDPLGPFVCAGDVDGDGHADVIVTNSSAVAADNSRGQARIVSGADGSTIRLHVGAHDWEYLGGSFCGLRDVDGDQADDYAISASGGRYDDPGRHGFVRIYSGRTGEVLHEFRDPAHDDSVEIAPAGDVDGDGATDLLVGRTGWGSTPLLIVSGRDGSVLSRRDETGVREFGSAGDVDGDGVPDLRIRTHTLVSRVESGRDGHVIVEFEGRELGSGVADLDRDGHADLLRLTNKSAGLEPDPPQEVWDNIWHEGLLEVVSGRDGSVLLRVDGAAVLRAR